MWVIAESMFAVRVLCAAMQNLVFSCVPPRWLEVKKKTLPRLIQPRILVYYMVYAPPNPRIPYTIRYTARMSVWTYTVYFQGIRILGEAKYT